MTSTEKLQSNLPFREKLNNSPKKTKALIDYIYKACILAIRLVCHINGGLEVKGKDNIPAEKGVIIASNHISYLDPPLIGAALPRRATFMARKRLFTMPILGWFMKRYAISVDRGKTLPSTVKGAIMRLKNGELLVMFPEGRRSVTGELTEGKRGIGMIASHSRATVVPTLIIGSNKALPVDAKWLKRAKVFVIFDKPIDLSTIKGEGNKFYENISQEIMRAIGELKKRYADISS